MLPQIKSPEKLLFGGLWKSICATRWTDNIYFETSEAILPKIVKKCRQTGCFKEIKNIIVNVKSLLRMVLKYT